MCKKTTFLARVNRLMARIPDVDALLWYYVQTTNRYRIEDRIYVHPTIAILNDAAVVGNPIVLMVMQYPIPCIILGPAPDVARHCRTSTPLLAAEAVMVVL